MHVTSDQRDQKEACEKKVVVIKGILVPKKWDREGNVTAVSVSTFDEREVLVSGWDEGLLGFLREAVEVEGIPVSEDGELMIRVSRCRLLGGFPYAQEHLGENGIEE